MTKDQEPCAATMNNDKMTRRRSKRGKRLSFVDSRESSSMVVKKVDRLSFAESAGACISRASWFQDALTQQGLSSDDVQTMLEEEVEKADEVHNPDDDQLAEQHKMMALLEAKKLLNDTLGYDVESSARKLLEEQKQSKTTAARTVYSCQPERPVYIHKPQESILEPAGRQMNISPKFEVPFDQWYFSRAIIGREPPDSKVVYGTELDDDGFVDGDMLVSTCELCSKQFSFPLQSILVRCPHCQ